MPTDRLSDVRTIAGFWRRLAAFFLDFLALGIVGVTVGFFFTEEFVRLGPWGLLLGFSVAFAYFATK